MIKMEDSEKSDNITYGENNDAAIFSITENPQKCNDSECDRSRLDMKKTITQKREDNTEDKQSSIENKIERKLILKNIILISVAFHLNFTAYHGLARLQSSLHHDGGMGVINQSILYGGLVIACFFLAKLVVGVIGHKWAIAMAFSSYVAWMAANGYAVWGTMTTASVLVGLTAAPLWTAHGSYFTIVSFRYATLTRELEKTVVARFFGAFFCIMLMSNLTGSVISSAVLTPKDPTYIPDDWDLQHCGRNDCPRNNISNSGLNDPSLTTVWVMVGAYTCITVVAVIIVSVFVDNLPDKYTYKDKVHLTDICQLVTGTAKHMGHRKQLLLIPLSIYNGLEQASYNAEFSASFVTCSVGIWKVGLVTICFGMVNAVASFIGGRLLKYTGRLPIFVTGFVGDLSIMIILLTWMPHPSQEYALYVVAGLWGFTDSIWRTQISALYGVLFVNRLEAAYSSLCMWQSLGYIMAFAYSSFLCTYVKIYILISMLFLGFIGYLFVEYNEFKAKMIIINAV